MESSAPPFEATDSPVLSLVDKRLHDLRKKHERRMEESIASGTPINKEQEPEDVLDSKSSILACIRELEDLRAELSSALKEELSLATQRLPRDDDIPASPETGEANDNAAEDDGTAGATSSTHTSTEAQGHDFEVFLSFRGPDVRPGFVDFLYTSLTSVGIHTFKDDKTLRKGKDFEDKLFDAIEGSKFFIPIFTKDYASSPWCLKEAAKMVECLEAKGQMVDGRLVDGLKTNGHKIKPIFYNVAASEVRHQIGGYAEAFCKHEEKSRYDKKTMQNWRKALTAFSFINGWDLHSLGMNRREGEFVKTVVQEVFKELKKADLVVPDCFVSVDNHVNAIMGMIGAGTSETRIIGIYGMGGIGKTTIAKVIYNELLKDFEHCCFLYNIREMSERNGIECLQQQLLADILDETVAEIKNVEDGTKAIETRLSTKRVLLLLDDVDQKKHLDALVGKRNWFATGSKLILTTRNKEVLKHPKVDNDYEVTGMDYAQSLQLFSKHAFESNSHLVEHMDLSRRAIGIAGGLPLALEVIGSLLRHTEKGMWDATLKNLESVPHHNVQSKLKISYDALDFRQKYIFLDIACLFIGYDNDILIHYWDESIFFPKEAMKVLKRRALIKIDENNEVWMHDQLRLLGKEIVLEKSDTKIQKQSRVWDPKEGLNLLRKHEGKKKVEALRLKTDRQRQYCFTDEDFKGLSDLRFLEVNDSMKNFRAQDNLLWDSPSQENSHLLPQLRWLSWRRIPPSFKITNFSMEDVVFLDLSWSEITDDWKGWSHIEGMNNLKVFNMAGCTRLGRTPIFSAYSTLERLILRGCESLMGIGESICQLKCLVFLDVSYCKNLWRLPDELGRDLKKLKHLSLARCESLEKLPDTIGNLESLTELDISGTNIRELPDSIGKLKNLKILMMRDIDLSRIKFPDGVWEIEKLEEIEVHKKSNTSNFNVEIGRCICRNQSLRILRLKGASILALPRLPESLIELQLSELYMNVFPDLSNLANLKKLDLRFGDPCSYDKYGCVRDPIPRWMGNLSKLESLALRFDGATIRTTDPSLPPQLKSLSLWGLNLDSLTWLPSSLSSLSLERCDLLCSMVDLSNLENLSSLKICLTAITEIQGLRNSNKLRSFRVENCAKLVEVQGVLPQSLEVFEIFSCKSLQTLPDLSSFRGKGIIEIKDCGELVEGGWAYESDLED